MYRFLKGNKDNNWYMIKANIRKATYKECPHLLSLLFPLRAAISREANLAGNQDYHNLELQACPMVI